MDYMQKVRFMVRKGSLIGDSIKQGDILRGDHREFNQRRVYEANLAALMQYRHQRHNGSNSTLDVFGTARLFEAGSGKPCTNWEGITGLPARYYQVNGQDSGDMLAGAHAETLALLIEERLRHAPNA
jgi:hypothetical protein